MEYYQEYQRTWQASKGKGLMPIHSSGEAERLVTRNDTLGYARPLAELVIRRPDIPRSSAESNGHRDPSFQAQASYTDDDEL